MSSYLGNLATTCLTYTFPIPWTKTLSGQPKPSKMLISRDLWAKDPVSQKLLCVLSLRSNDVAEIHNSCLIPRRKTSSCAPTHLLKTYDEVRTGRDPFPCGSAIDRAPSREWKRYELRGDIQM